MVKVTELVYAPDQHLRWGTTILFVSVILLRVCLVIPEQLTILLPLFLLFGGRHSKLSRLHKVPNLTLDKIIIIPSRFLQHVLYRVPVYVIFLSRTEMLQGLLLFLVILHRGVESL